MPPVGFELAISAGERPQTYALDCAATGTDKLRPLLRKTKSFYLRHCSDGLGHNGSVKGVGQLTRSSLVYGTQVKQSRYRPGVTQRVPGS
jgi:hypothetical protein